MHSARDLARVAFGSSAVSLAFITAITLLELVIAGSDLTGALGAIATIWLACHQVPIVLEGCHIGLLPLIPTALMVAATARVVGKTHQLALSTIVRRWILFSVVAGPIFIGLFCVLIVHDASIVLTQLHPPPWPQALCDVAGVHILGAVIGYRTPIMHYLRTSLGVPSWIEQASRGALGAVMALVGLSGIITTLSMIIHWQRMDDCYGIAHSFFAQLSLTVLAMLYIPNMLIGASAMTVGSTLHLGKESLSAFSMTDMTHPLLPFPLFAALPTPPLGPMWSALLIIAASSAVVVGQQCARRVLPLAQACASVMCSSAFAAVVMGLLSYLAGGQLGNLGVFHVDYLSEVGGIFCWFSTIGIVTVFLIGGIQFRPALASWPSLRELEPSHSSSRSSSPLSSSAITSSSSADTSSSSSADTSSSSSADTSSSSSQTLRDSSVAITSSTRTTSASTHSNSSRTNSRTVNPRAQNSNQSRKNQHGIRTHRFPGSDPEDFMLTDED